MSPEPSFLAVDANWDCALELYQEVSEVLPGCVVEVREWIQAWHAGWYARGQMSVRRLGCGLWRQRFALPAGWFHSLNAVSMPVLGRVIVRKARRVLGATPEIWVFSSPYYLRMLKSVRPAFSVYHVLDDYRWYWPHLADRTARLEAAIVSSADLVICASRYNRDRLQRASPTQALKIVHVPNGAPEAFYQEPEAPLLARVRERLGRFQRPWFAYTGDPWGRVDLAMVRSLASATTGTIIFTGNARMDPSLRACPNVRSVGRLEPEEVPALLRVVDVLLIPQQGTDFNRASSPRKLWEYCAAGTPIVGACLTEVDPLSDGIRVAGTAGEFLRHALDLAAGRDSLEARQARVRLAEQHRYPVLASRYLSHVLERWQAKLRSSGDHGLEVG
jgi:hypothetical protein